MMIKELAQMITEKLEAENRFQNKCKENDALYEEVSLLQEKVDKLQLQVNTLLDELVDNQVRIDALLRQLKEKHCGK